jgi:hypothetical protein
MADKECIGCERKLVYIPIVHTLADMGTLGASVQSAKLARLGRQGLAHSAAVAERMWKEIERVAGSLPVSPGKVRVYQDGLPVCGREREIVAELAAAGSRNHRLLLSLEARGAALMGAESPELLIEEYRLASSALAAGAAPRIGVRPDRARDALLEQWDLGTRRKRHPVSRDAPRRRRIPGSRHPARISAWPAPRQATGRRMRFG